MAVGIEQGLEFGPYADEKEVNPALNVVHEKRMSRAPVCSGPTTCKTDPYPMLYAQVARESMINEQSRIATQERIARYTVGIAVKHHHQDRRKPPG
jgi:hypothetical protein